MDKMKQEVAVGQYYEDLDRRGRGRRLKVVNILYGGQHAELAVVYDPRPNRPIGRTTKVRISRLRDRYRLVDVATPKQAGGPSPASA